jgi:hypothetical protein
MRLDARQKAYFAVRGVAAVVFLLAAVVLPRGVPAALLAMVAGLSAVMTCFSTNAGGPGERAGAAPQDRWFDSVRAPQGDWPPYVAARAEAAARAVEAAAAPEREAR